MHYIKKISNHFVLQNLLNSNGNPGRDEFTIHCLYIIITSFTLDTGITICKTAVNGQWIAHAKVHHHQLFTTIVSMGNSMP